MPLSRRTIRVRNAAAGNDRIVHANFVINEMLTAGKVRELTGLTKRKLQWLDAKGVLSSYMEEQTRRKTGYTEQEVAEVMLIAELRSKRISLQDVRRVLNYLRRSGAGIPKSGYILLGLAPSVDQIRRVQRISLENDAAGVCRTLSEWTGSGMLVEIPASGTIRLHGKRPRAGRTLPTSGLELNKESEPDAPQSE